MQLTSQIKEHSFKVDQVVEQIRNKRDQLISKELTLDLQRLEVHKRVLTAKETARKLKILNHVDCLQCTLEKNPDLTFIARKAYEVRDQLLYNDLRNDGFHCSKPEHIAEFHRCRFEGPPQVLLPKWSCCHAEFVADIESETKRLQ